MNFDEMGWFCGELGQIGLNWVELGWIRNNWVQLGSIRWIGWMGWIGWNQWTRGWLWLALCDLVGISSDIITSKNCWDGYIGKKGWNSLDGEMIW